MTTISVVIPAYNAENTIKTSIDSVLNQTLLPNEIIVVDDGSIDETVSVVSQYGQRVNLICQSNGGSSSARQAGTCAAKCDYIAYLDADDWWPEDKIQKIRDIVLKEDIDFLLSDLQRSRPGDDVDDYLPKNSSFFPWIRQYFNKETACLHSVDLYKLNPEVGLTVLLQGFPVFPSTLVVRKSVVDSVGGWDVRFRRCQDFDLGLRIARYHPLYYLDDVQAILGLHSGNDDAYSYIVKQTMGDIKVLMAHLDDVKAYSIYRKQLTKAIGRKFCCLGYTHRKACQFRMACKCYAEAICWPGSRLHAIMRLILTVSNAAQKMVIRASNSQ